MITDYQRALNLVNNPVSQTTIDLPANLAHFRKYLYALAAAKQLKFVTRKQGNKLTVKQIKYYEIN